MKNFGFDRKAHGWLAGFALALTIGASAVPAGAQALPTATKSLSLAVFGGASGVKPDYTTETALGFVVGGDITRSFRIVTVSIEPRYGMASGNFTTETYLAGNLKLERALGSHRQFHPFIGGGIGTGKLHLGAPFESDQTSSPIYDVIGGLDYDFKSKFGVKLEGQYQFWDFGYYSNGLTPSGVNVAIYYRPTGFSFHRHR